MISCARLSPGGTHFHGVRRYGNGGRVKPALRLSTSVSGPSLWRQALRCHTLPMGIRHRRILQLLFSGFGETRGAVPQVWPNHAIWTSPFAQRELMRR